MAVEKHAEVLGQERLFEKLEVCTAARLRCRIDIDRASAAGDLDAAERQERTDRELVRILSALVEVAETGLALTAAKEEQRTVQAARLQSELDLQTAELVEQETGLEEVLAPFRAAPAAAVSPRVRQQFAEWRAEVREYTAADKHPVLALRPHRARLLSLVARQVVATNNAAMARRFPDRADAFFDDAVRHLGELEAGAADGFGTRTAARQMADEVSLRVQAKVPFDTSSLKDDALAATHLLALGAEVQQRAAMARQVEHRLDRTAANHTALLQGAAWREVLRIFTAKAVGIALDDIVEMSGTLTVESAARAMNSVGARALSTHAEWDRSLLDARTAAGGQQVAELYGGRSFSPAESRAILARFDAEARTIADGWLGRTGHEGIVSRYGRPKEPVTFQLNAPLAELSPERMDHYWVIAIAGPQDPAAVPGFAGLGEANHLRPAAARETVQEQGPGAGAPQQKGPNRGVPEVRADGREGLGYTRRPHP